ncbi:putative DNA-binding protein [Evansella sp. AB-P1]|uniref:putative DNA-binding protein n=1 Tax=Evansella sp. AB-P1 TaxID=3037653 RepID=UPI00241CDB94|nr:putative DNA-binding protein [Evansella sp. AB-P1]MDG5788219.1 putative DNA-binding protein [Evansella sp. AB-P1]
MISYCKVKHLNKAVFLLIEKTIRMNYLYDFYQQLLTEKQNQYMVMYYLDDLSLGEIADHFHVSRQAVYDNIKRTETLLEEYENKLLLFNRYGERQQLLHQLKSVVKENGSPDKMIELIESLENLE